ncbi:hypothetical protein [Vibrio harveyi]|uniref:hypothetical protein n=1 Tax=Vibrio harveyi TaxID=669 RepID=UPI003BB7F52A
MNKKQFLTASIMVVLAACGSDNSNNDRSSTTITALDGYLANAKVFVDSNNNMTLDSGDSLLGRTDNNGRFALSEEYQGSTIFVQSIAGETLDSYRGMVTENFTLASGAGNAVVSPMTNTVVELLAMDSSLTQQAAEQQVIDSLSTLSDNSDLIFGDYLAHTTASATALKVIGEQLVDHQDLSTKRKLEINTVLSDELQRAIENNNGALSDDFYPLMDIPSNDDDPIFVSANHKPSVTGELSAVTINLGDEFTDIDLSTKFVDLDGDTLTYVLHEINELEHNLTINDDGLLSGELDKAGVYQFEIIAFDAHGAKSYPLSLKVTVQAQDNALPVVDQQEFQRLQSEINLWSLQEGEAVNYSLDVGSLFNDSDTLTYRADSTLTVNNDGGDTGFALLVSGSHITFDSVLPRSADAGSEKLYIWAKDSINAEEVYAIFELPQIAESEGYSDPHFLIGSFWHFTSTDIVGDNQVAQTVCETVYFDEDHYSDDNSTKAYFGKRTVSDASQCAEQSMDSLDMENPISLVRTSWGTLQSVDYVNDGISWNVYGGASDGVWGNSHPMVRLSYIERNPKTGDLDSELINYYQSPEVINSTLLQPVSIGDEIEWVSRDHILVFYDEFGGHDRDFPLSAAMREYQEGGVLTASALLRSYGDSGCTALEQAYKSQMYVIGGGGRFAQIPTYYEDGQYCYVEVKVSDGLGVEQGTYSIDVYPYSDDILYENLRISFVRD